MARLVALVGREARHAGQQQLAVALGQGQIVGRAKRLLGERLEVEPGHSLAALGTSSRRLATSITSGSPAAASVSAAKASSSPASVAGPSGW